MEILSYPLFGSLLLEGAVLSKKEKKIIADYQEVRAVNLFSGKDFSYIQDMAANHFQNWCIDVLAANFWDLFKPCENEQAKHLVQSLKCHLRQSLSQLLALEGDQEFNMELEYEYYIWRCPCTI